MFKRLWQKVATRESDTIWVETQEAGFPHLIDEFLVVIADLDSPNADLLKHQVQRSETPRELWFLRERIFLMVAGKTSESEATRRIRRLDERLWHYVEQHRYEYRRDELPSQPPSVFH